MARSNTTRRSAILEAMAELFEKIDGGDGYKSDLSGSIEPRMKFWDEVDEFPALHLNAGSETREYRTAGVRDRFLSVTIRCYVQEEDAQEAPAHITALAIAAEDAYEEMGNVDEVLKFVEMHLRGAYGDY